MKIQLTANEKRLLKFKSSLIGTDAKDPERGLYSYVEKLISEYIFLSSAATLGTLGGRSTSEAKKAAARFNGKKGGRPKKSLPLENK